MANVNNQMGLICTYPFPARRWHGHKYGENHTSRPYIAFHVRRAVREPFQNLHPLFNPHLVWQAWKNYKLWQTFPNKLHQKAHLCTQCHKKVAWMLTKKLENNAPCSLLQACLRKNFKDYHWCVVRKAIFFKALHFKAKNYRIHNYLL